MSRFQLKLGQRSALGFAAVLSLLAVAVGTAILFQRPAAVGQWTEF
ncbi:hypothetical protein [Solimonas variicoloris]|nr:hypothetical protein [Solimonas variicoloris]